MIYAIASYHRPECKTVRTLLETGVPKGDIVVSLQDEADIPLYKTNYPDVRFVYRKTDCAGGNRNTLLSEIKERPICLLDDDITSFKCFVGDRFLSNTKKALKELETFAEKCQNGNCEVAGVASTDNGIIARNRPEISVDTLLQGSCLMFFSPDLRFNESFKMVEDYELSLRVLYKGDHVFRANHIACCKPKNGTNDGRMHARYARGELSFWLNLLHKRYPIFKVNKNKTGGTI